MLFFHQPFLIFIDSWLMNWGSLEMQLKFLLDCLMAWWRVVLLCLLTIRRSSWWSKKEPHWYLHESFISNGLGMSSCAHDFMRHYRQTSINYWRLLARECTPRCSDWRWWKQASDWLIWGELHPTSHQPSSLSPRKVQCLVAFNITCGLLICSPTSYEWVLLL